MYNDILDAVTRRLNELFGDDYEIYTDPVKQGLTEPCFFVQILEPTEKPMIGLPILPRNRFCHPIPSQRNAANPAGNEPDG